MASSQWVVSPICYSTALVVVGVRVRIPVRLNFLKLSFRNYISCDLNCGDHLCIYFFIPRFNKMEFMYSSFHQNLCYPSSRFTK